MLLLDERDTLALMVQQENVARKEQRLEQCTCIIVDNRQGFLLFRAILAFQEKRESEVLKE